MKYIIRKENNKIFLKLNTIPQNPYSGKYKWTCKHIQTGGIITLILDDESPVSNNYQLFNILSGDSENFLLGQYNCDIYDVTGGTKIKTELMTAQDKSQEGNQIYFMSNSNTATIYNGSATSIPDIPENLNPTLTDNTTVKLTWKQGSSNTDAYDLWRKEGTGGTYINLNPEIQSFNYSDSYLLTGTTFYYKIRAYNNIGYSDFSSEVNITTSLIPSTGVTWTNLIGSGGTTTIFVNGENNVDTWIIRSAVPTGSTVQWGDVVGNIQEQIDLQDQFDTKLDITDFETYSANTQNIFTGYTATTDTRLIGIENNIDYISGVTDSNYNIFTGYTATTDIHLDVLDNQINYISGQTDLKLFTSDFDNYTGTTDVILSDLRTDINTVSGLTASNYNLITGNTVNIVTNSNDIVTNSNDIDSIELITDLLYTGSTHATNLTPKLWANTIIGASALQLSTGSTITEHYAGQFHWDNNESTVSLGLLNDVNLQIGQEQVVYGKNINGVQIPNGTVVKPYGATGGTLLIGKAIADSTIQGHEIGITTQDVEANSFGYATTFGKVRKLNTSAWSGGTSLWLSPLSAGTLTDVEPIYPQVKIPCGVVTKQDAVEGEIYFNPIVDYQPQINNLEYYDDYFVGTFVDKVTQTVYETGGTVYITIEKDVVSGSTDFRILIGTDNILTFSAQTIALNAGTDNIPVLNYVSMTTSGIQNKTGWFTGNSLDLDGIFSAVATVLVQSPSGVSANNVYKHHGWIDKLQTDTRGDNVKVAERLRQEHAKYKTGILQTFLRTPNGAALDRIDISTTQGVVYQKNRNTFPIMTTVGDTNPIWIANLDAGGYLEETDIGKMNFTTDGVVLNNNRWVSIVIWGVVSQNTGDCKYFANLSTGSYGSLVLATNDAQHYAQYGVSDDFKGTAFLISRVIVKYTTASNGTWAIESSIDLRGVDIGTISGVIGGGGTIAVKNSIEQDVDLIYQLVGDELIPDSGKFYGITGTSKGWYNIPEDITKLNITDFETYSGVTDTTLSGIENDIDIVSGLTLNNATDIVYISGITDTKLNITDFETYSGVTDTTLSGLRTDIDIVSGLTLNNATDIIYLSGQTDTKLNITDFETYSGETDTRINNNENDIVYISGITDTKLNITDFETYSGVTDTTLSGIENDIIYISGITDTKLNITDFETYSGETDTRINNNENDIVYISGITDTKLNITDFETYSGVTDTTLSGIENDIIYISGITDTKLNITDFETYSGETDTRINNNENDIIYLSGQTDTKLNITDFETYSGVTDTTLSGIENDIVYISGITDTKLNITDFETYSGVTETTLNGKVNNTGNETIAGVKTFSTFPITPSSAPTTNYQVSNKKYVDDSGISFGANNQIPYTNSTTNDFDYGVGLTYNDLTLRVSGTLSASKGRTPTDSHHAITTENAIFDDLNVAIPNINDEIIINGIMFSEAIHRDYSIIVSKVIRTSSTTMDIYGMLTSLMFNLIVVEITNGDSTAITASLAW